MRFGAIALTVVVLLAGCASGGTPTSNNEGEGPAMTETTLEETKALTIEMQDRLATYVPAENVADQRSVTLARLLPCEGEGEYKWPGGVTIALTGDVDRSAIVSAIRTDFEGEAGWTLSDLPQNMGEGVELRHEDTRGFFVAFSKAGDEFLVSSFSACFPFEPGLTEKY